MKPSPKGHVWIARGFVAADRNAVDALLTDHVWPLADALEADGLVRRWYTSRREPQEDRDMWRARLYCEVPTRTRHAVATEIVERSKEHAVTFEEAPTYTQRFDWDELRMACDVARDVLPTLTARPRKWREGREGMRVIIRHVRAVRRVQNSMALHWVENNLGLESWALHDAIFKAYFGR